MPSTVTGFVPTGNAWTPVQSCPVEIATLYAEGPRPITYSVPPPPEKHEADKYSTSLPFVFE